MLSFGVIGVLVGFYLFNFKFMYFDFYNGFIFSNEIRDYIFDLLMVLFIDYLVVFFLGGVGMNIKI